VKLNTIARSIAVGNPADGYDPLRVARQSGAGACAVTDEEVVEGMELLAKSEGISTKTARDVVIAGLTKLATSGIIRRDELMVAFITGAGLKIQEVTAKKVHPFVIQPALESFQEVFDQ